MKHTGRMTVIMVIAIQLFVSIAVIGFYLWGVGTDRLPQQLIRLGFSILICIGLIKGKNWVRILNLALLGMGLAYWAYLWVGMGMAINFFMMFFWAYLFAFMLLLSGPGVKEYFADKAGS